MSVSDTKPHGSSHAGAHGSHFGAHGSHAGAHAGHVGAHKHHVAREAKPPAPPGTVYTCPMHPQIRQIGPGTCPICGMALEPEVASLETGPNPELADMTRRFWIGG